jgi:methyl-accepting chemotaxis protein
MLASLLSPAVLFMRKLSLSRKFTLVSAAFLAPLIYLLYIVVTDRHDQYSFTAKEVLGRQAMLAFEPVYAPSIDWRAANLEAGAKHEGAVARRLNASGVVEEQLKRFEQALQANRDPLNLAPELAKLRALWDKVKVAEPTDAGAGLELGNEFVKGVRTFMEFIANNSNLALDPEADSYALMLAYISELPRLTDALGRVRAVGRHLAAQQTGVDAEMFMAMHNGDALTDEYLGRAEITLAAVKASNPAATAAIKMATLTDIEQKIIARIDKEFVWGMPPKAKPDEWFSTVTRGLTDLHELHNETGVALDAILLLRQQRLSRELWIAVVVATAFIAVGMYLLCGFYVAAMSTFAALDRRIKKIGKGDFTQPARMEGHDELAHAGNHLATAMEDLSLLILQMRASAEEINNSVQEIAAGNQDLSNRGSQMAAIVEQTSASTSTLEETVGVNLASAQEANELVQSAALVAGKGGAVVEQAVESMAEITASSKKIGDIIQVIDTIAFQTNILALNAAVEAARAGEQGRGFAVVAGEVRALAQRSAGAAREIKSLIQSSIETVVEGGQYVNEAGNTMTEMVRAIERVTSLMSDITRQSNNQAQQIRELGSAIREVDSTTQQNAAMVEQTAAAAASLSDRARSLSETAAQFKTD